MKTVDVWMSMQGERDEDEQMRKEEDVHTVDEQI